MIDMAKAMMTAEAVDLRLLGLQQIDERMNIPSVIFEVAIHPSRASLDIIGVMQPNLRALNDRTYSLIRL